MLHLVRTWAFYFCYEYSF